MYIYHNYYLNIFWKNVSHFFFNNNNRIPIITTSVCIFVAWTIEASAGSNWNPSFTPSMRKALSVSSINSRSQTERTSGDGRGSGCEGNHWSWLSGGWETPAWFFPTGLITSFPVTDVGELTLRPLTALSIVKQSANLWTRG